MLHERLGTVPDNWLSNYAYARGEGTGLRIAMLTLFAAFRWNGVPSLPLLRAVASSLIRRGALRV